MYKVHNKIFEEKTDLKLYVKSILNNRINQYLNGDELQFFLDYIQYHDHNYLISEIINIQVLPCNKLNHLTIFVEFKGKKNKPSNPIPVSLNRCLNNIPPYYENTEDYIFTFGKHIGKNIREVDEDYLKWIVNQKKFFNKHIQNIILNYLKRQ